jgi:hypothetical protein
MATGLIKFIVIGKNLKKL